MMKQKFYDTGNISAAEKYSGVGYIYSKSA